MSRALLLYALIFTNCLTKSFTQDLKIIGTSSRCGVDNIGTIFKYDYGTNQIDTVFNFTNLTPGGFPLSQKMIEADNGNLYGMTNQGGFSGLGVLFEYNPASNSYQSLHDFKGLDGSTPMGSLVQSSNGKLYGMTRFGGEFDVGVLFEYDVISASYLNLVDFESSIGKTPFGDLIEVQPSQLFGLTATGGSFNKGVLFKYDILADTLEVLYHFDGINGSRPYGNLIQIGNFLFGVTQDGGAENLGTIFKFNWNTNEFSKLLDFNGVNGERPAGHLTLGPNGNLYGTTERGGPLKDFGLLFEFNPNTNAYNIRYEFFGINGHSPSGHLLLAANNKFYGITSGGGDGNGGTLYEFNPSNNFYLAKISFGNNPEFESKLNLTGLAEISNGNIYGMATNGGNYGAGVIFRYNYNTNDIQQKINFDYIPNGALPSSGLFKGRNGYSYGITLSGGEFGHGVLFRFDLQSNSYYKLHDFNDDDGYWPTGYPIEADDNKIYGMTKYGGINNEGVLYQYDPVSNVTNIVFDFANFDSSSPVGSLLQASNGLIYGVTEGSPDGKSVIFAYNPQTGDYSSIFEFNVQNGFKPLEGLIEGDNGLLYGTTYFGGTNNTGVLYSININDNNLYTKIYEFSVNDIVGYGTEGKLTLATNGNIYGANRNGGAGAQGGVIFQYNPINNDVKAVIDFEFNTTYAPIGGLLSASNNKLYGCTKYGGEYSNGVIYEYDFINDVYNEIYSYTGELICDIAPNLIEVPFPLSSNRLLSVPNSYIIFPNPATTQINIKNNTSIKTSSENTIEIYDNIGKKYFHIKNHSKDIITINIENLPTGIYVTKITNSFGNINFIKFIKK